MATRSLGQLTLDVIAKIGGFTRGMDEAERIADRKSREIAAKQKARAREIEAAWSSVGRFVAGAFAGISVSGIVQVIRATNDGVDALNDFSEATGTTVENASALDDIARRTGASLQTVESIVLKLNKTLDDLKPDSAEASVLKQIGLDAEQLKRQDPAEALRQIAGAVQQLDDASKAQAFRILFDKTVREAAPFLNDLAKEGQLVAKVTKEQAEEAERFNRALADLNANVVELSRSLVGPLVSAFNRVADAQKEAGAAGEGFWARQFAGYRAWVRGIYGLADDAKKAADVVNQALGPRDELRRLEAGMRSTLVLPPAATRPERTPRAPRAGRDERLEAAKRQQQQYFQWLDDQREQQEEEMRESAENITRQEKQSLEARQLQMKQYFEWIDQQAEDADEAARIAAGIGDKVKDTNDAARDLGMTFASAFEDAIVEGKKLSDVLKALEQDILRIVTRKLVTEPLANFVSGAVGGGGGGLLGSLAGLLGFRAQGGPVMAGGAYVVGENGPELFQPDSAGTVIPAPQTQKILGGSRINIVQNFAPGTDRRTIEQAAAMTGVAVQRAVARQT